MEVLLWSPPTSPAGGHFLALDGESGNLFPSTSFGDINKAKVQGEISQNVTLTTNTRYTVSFLWAAGQQTAALGDTKEQVGAELCPSSVSTGRLTLGTVAGTFSPGLQSNGCTFYTKPFTNTAASNGRGRFMNWTPEHFDVTASSPSETLSFLALGFPQASGRPVMNALPPIVLLDGVSVQESAPEPDSSLLLGIGFAAMAGFAYWRRKWICVRDQAGDA